MYHFENVNFSFHKCQLKNIFIRTYIYHSFIGSFGVHSGIVRNPINPYPFENLINRMGRPNAELLLLKFLSQISKVTRVCKGGVRATYRDHQTLPGEKYELIFIWLVAWSSADIYHIKSRGRIFTISGIKHGSTPWFLNNHPPPVHPRTVHHKLSQRFAYQMRHY